MNPTTNPSPNTASRIFGEGRTKLSEMRNMYTGRAAAVLGGGPSLVSDLKKLPEGCVLIAVNYHGLYHCDHIDFMVYNDAPETNPLQENAVREHRTVHVSPEPSSDVLFDVDHVWTGHFSSNTAAWFALWLGCDPVILCGMDCYQGDVKHCYPSTYDSPVFHFGLDHYTRPWIEEGLKVLPNVEHVKAMSGPLVDVFGKYTPRFDYAGAPLSAEVRP